MSAPTWKLNSKVDADGLYTRNPHWVVAFVRFKEPCAMQSGDKSKGLETEDMLIVENDCQSVNISNSKSSFAKTAQLQMKVGEVWYQNAVSPGDWVFIWMHDNDKDSEFILNGLMSNQAGLGATKEKGKTKLNGWNSGLKFMGRVMDLSNGNAISPNGTISLSQTISCQAFTEMANSVYYTYISKALLAASGAQTPEEAGTTVAQGNIRNIKNGLDTAMTDIANKFLNIHDGGRGFVSPEEVIAILFILIMGVDNENSIANVTKAGGLTGSFGDAIGIPSQVANIMSRSGKTKLYQLYNVILGLQKYSGGKKTGYENFSPDLDAQSAKQNSKSVFFKTQNNTKGVVPLQIPPVWDNNNLWSVMSGYLNPVVNEMFTSLRMNKFGEIVPTLTVREQPFSTGLYKYLEGKASQFEKVPVEKGKVSKGQEAYINALKASDEAQENARAKLAKTESLKLTKDHTGKDLKERSFYCNVPRWVMPLSHVKSVNISTSESRRINFVQVWGRSNAVEFVQGNTQDAEGFKTAQFLAKNYVADEADIHRNGLRADITETPFDIPLDSQAGTLANVIARMRADWLFNGHMKLSGSIVCNGIQEPICEGDNLEINGLVFHIMGVNHSASYAGNGMKTFTTTLQLDHGILASSLKSPTDIPMYYKSVGKITDTVEAARAGAPVPSQLDIQATGARKDRNINGEKTKKK